jgi:hypothetical protein
MQPKDGKGYRDAVHAPPTVYAAENGHWDGMRNTGVFMGLTDVVTDPHIQVYDGSRALVFDSVDTSIRDRTLAYDSEKGIISFSQHLDPITIHYSPQSGYPYGDPRIAIAAPDNRALTMASDLSSSTVQFTVMPAGLSITTGIERTLKVKAVLTVGDTKKEIEFHRGGAGLGVGQGYMTGPSRIANDFTTSRDDGGTLNPDGIEERLIVRINAERINTLMVQNGVQTVDFVFEFDVQDNQASDTVKISYTTPALLSITMSPRIYASGSTRPETFQLTSTVKPTNLRR